MEKLICILCPRGCHLSLDENGKVTGNFCIRGVKYYTQEIEDPQRTLTSTVFIANRDHLVVPVKSDKPLPKKDILKAMEVINSIVVNAPIKVGDVVYKNILGLDIDIIATKNIF